MQNAFKPTFSPKGVKNNISSLLLCLHPLFDSSLESVLDIYTSLQRAKGYKAFPRFVVRCLLSVEAFAQVLDKLLVVVFERAGAV